MSTIITTIAVIVGLGLSVEMTSEINGSSSTYSEPPGQLPPPPTNQ